MIYPLTISSQFINNKNILITGGTGSFGNQMVKTLLKFNPQKIIVFSRDEYKQYEMRKKFNPNKYPNMRYLIGDIRDLERLKFAFKDVDLIFHAAALKQVPAMEYNPGEAIKTNIYGAENVITAALVNNVSRVIAISTDKAVSPTNLYGATKMCFEKLFLSNDFSLDEVIYGEMKGQHTKFSIMRYGNVFGSRGSVVPLFLKQQQEGQFTITHPDMTRFTISLEDAINFVLNCSETMIGGEIFIPKLPSYNIVDLAKSINNTIPINTMGIRPGEKMDECMISESESCNTLNCKNEFIIIPIVRFNNKNLLNYYLQHYTKLNKFIKLRDEGEYNSKENDHLSTEQLSLLVNEFIYINPHFKP